jgi:hypothetical protein
MHPLAGKTVQLICDCGWSDTVPSMAGGITIECPKCGRNLRVPLSGPASFDSASDIAAIERITGRNFTDPASKEAAALVPLMYLAMLSVLPLAGISLIFWNNYWPAGAVFPIGGLLWAAGITIARLGVVRAPSGGSGLRK